MTSVAQFQTRFPEFCTEDDDRVQLFLDDAALVMTSPNKWLSFYDVAQAYLAAHFLAASYATERDDYGVQAPIKKQEVDDVVIEQAVNAVDVDLESVYSTSYGKRYAEYRRKTLTGIYGV